MGEDARRLEQQVERRRRDISAVLEAIARHADLSDGVAIANFERGSARATDGADASARNGSASDLVPTDDRAREPRVASTEPEAVVRLALPSVSPTVLVVASVALVCGTLLGNALPRRL